MARRAHRSRSVPSADITNNASDPLTELLVLGEPDPLPLNPVSIIDEFLQPAIPFDQRAFSFDADLQNPKMEVSRGSTPTQVSTIPSGVSVSRPEVLAVCVRRKERREVLFAFKKNGRGGAKKRRYNEWSKVHCR